MFATGERRRTATPAHGSARSSVQPTTPWRGSAASRPSYKSGGTAAGGGHDSSRLSGIVRARLDSTPQRSARHDSIAAPPTPKGSAAGSKGRTSGVSFGRDPPRHSSILESPAKRVSISGTTFLATDSEHEPHDPDPASMLDDLPALVGASDDALGELAPAGISRQLVMKCLRHRDFPPKVANKSSNVDSQKQSSSGTAHFIPASVAAQVLPSADGVEWKPERLYHKANLARLVLDVLALRGKSFEDSNWCLEQIDDHFPLYFLDSFQSDEARDSAFHLGLEIRTQWCLMLLRAAQQSDDAEDPKDIVENVFFGAPSLVPKPQELRGWDMDGLKHGDGDALPRVLQDTFRERVDHIRQTFDDGGDDNYNNYNNVDLDGLDEMFPWSEFVVRVATWVRDKADEIDVQLMLQRPLDQIVPILREELERRSSFGQQPHSGGVERDEPATAVSQQNDRAVSHGAGEVQRVEEGQVQPPQSNAEPPPRSQPNFKNKACFAYVERKMEALMQGRASHGHDAAESPAEATSATSPQAEKQPRDPERFQVPPGPFDAAIPEGSALDIFQAGQREKRREQQTTSTRHITDRQTGADRISPIDSGGSIASVNGTGTGTGAQRNGNGKRPRKRTADEVSEEDGRPTRGSSLLQRHNRDVVVEVNEERTTAKRRRVEGQHRSRQDDGRSTAKTRQRVVEEEGGSRDKSEDGARAGESSRGPERRTVTTVEASDARRGPPKTSRTLPRSMQQDRTAREASVRRDTARAPTKSRHRRVEEEEEEEDDDDGDGDYFEELIGDDDSTEVARPRPRPATTTSSRAINTAKRANYRPTSKKRWTEAESQRLVELVEKYGTSWSNIVDKDLEEPGQPKLWRRDANRLGLQVKVKDRARQIAFDYYKTQQPLPKYFEYIPLRRKMVEELQALGIEIAPTHVESEDRRDGDGDGDRDGD